MYPSATMKYYACIFRDIRLDEEAKPKCIRIISTV